jgi:hypothetical protein
LIKIYLQPIKDIREIAVPGVVETWHYEARPGTVDKVNLDERGYPN